MTQRPPKPRQIVTVVSNVDACTILPQLDRGSLRARSTHCRHGLLLSFQAFMGCALCGSCTSQGAWTHHINFFTGFATDQWKKSSSSSSSSFLQVFRPEPSKSDGTSSCSGKFPIFLSRWHRKWTSPAIILVGLKSHHEKHLENHENLF